MSASTTAAWPPDFYGTGNTESAGLLAELMNAICAAHGTRYRSVLKHIHILYGGEGPNVHEAVAQSDFYRVVGETRPKKPKTPSCRSGFGVFHSANLFMNEPPHVETPLSQN